MLFRINDEEYKLGVAKARAKLKTSQAQLKELQLELDRSKLLTDNNVTTKSDYELALAKYDAAKSQVEEAEAELNEANLLLSYATLKSPFSGFIDRILNKKGSLIDEGTLLTSITDIEKMYAYFHLSEREYLRDLKSLGQGSSFDKQEVSLILADGSTYNGLGVLQTMETEFEESTGSISVRSIFPNNEKILKHGSTGKVRLKRPMKNVIIIPQKAVIELQDKYYVYVINDSNQVHIQAINPVERTTSAYILKEGLKPGQKIVLEGIQRIKDGATVRLKAL